MGSGRGNVVAEMATGGARRGKISLNWKDYFSLIFSASKVLIWMVQISYSNDCARFLIRTNFIIAVFFVHRQKVQASIQIKAHILIPVNIVYMDTIAHKADTFLCLVTQKTW
jgi:hypothetical protein